MWKLTNRIFIPNHEYSISSCRLIIRNQQRCMVAANIQAVDCSRWGFKSAFSFPVSSAQASHSSPSFLHIFLNIYTIQSFSIYTHIQSHKVPIYTSIKHHKWKITDWHQPV